MAVSAKVSFPVKVVNAFSPFQLWSGAASLSGPDIALIVLGPAIGWGMLFCLYRGNPWVLLALALLSCATTLSHLIPTYFFLYEARNREFLWRHRRQFYWLPLALLIAFSWIYFRSFPISLSIYALMIGWHVALQNYGVMRLLDRGLGAVPARAGLNQAEKIVLIALNCLPALVLSLKASRLWTSGAFWAVGALFALASVALLVVAGARARDFPRPGGFLGRTAAFVSAAMMMTPMMRFDWVFHTEYGFLVAAFPHYLQYFACYRFYSSQRLLDARDETAGAVRSEDRVFKLAYMAGLLVMASIGFLMWLGLYRLELGLFVWLATIGHVFYDSRFWRNRVPHFRRNTMRYLGAAISSEAPWLGVP